MSPKPPTIGIDTPFNITTEQIESFQDQGFIRLKNVWSQANIITELRDCVAKEVSCADTTPLEDDDAYAKAFTQVMNLWERNDSIRRFVFGKRLASIAANLMQVEGVRIYHDQALCKEAGGGPTPWHADQHYWPVSSEKMVTAWIPLQAVPNEMGPLEFAVGSQKHDLGRHLNISADNECKILEKLSTCGSEIVGGPFNFGEVSFHAGWTFHRASSNNSSEPRQVFTIIFMDRDIQLMQPTNVNQSADVERWLPGIAVGDVCASSHNPIVWETDMNLIE